MTPERLEALRVVLAALEEAGVSKTTVAAALDCHPLTVQGWRRQTGLTARFHTPQARWTPEDELALRRATGLAGAMADLPSRTREAILLRKKQLRIKWPRLNGPNREGELARARNRADRQIMIPLEGEVWAELVAYGVRVSSLGRVASRRTCLLLEPKRNQVSCWFDGRRRYVTTRTLFALAFGQDAAPALHPKYWTEAEVQIIRSSKTYADAHARLPGRSRAALLVKASSIGVRLERSAPERRESAPARPHRDRLWSEAHAAVPRGLPEHVRDDLVMDMVVMRLEGFEGSMAEAFKAARTAYNRMTGAFIERSAFDTIAGTTIRLIDTFAEGSSL